MAEASQKTDDPAMVGAAPEDTIEAGVVSEWDRTLTDAFRRAADADATEAAARVAADLRAREAMRRDPSGVPIVASVGPATPKAEPWRPPAPWPAFRWFLLRDTATGAVPSFVSRYTHPGQFHPTTDLRDAMIFATPGEYATWLAGQNSQVRGRLQAFEPHPIVLHDGPFFDQGEKARIADAVVTGTRQGETNDGRAADQAARDRRDKLKRYEAATGQKAVADA